MVTKKPKGLGRGLSALLGPAVSEAAASAEAAPAGAPSTLRLDELVAGQYQPRIHMDEAPGDVLVFMTGQVFIFIAFHLFCLY